MRDEELAIAVADQRTNIFARHQAGYYYIARDRVIAQHIDETEKEPAGSTFDQSAPPRLLNAEHHIAIPLPHARMELAKQFGLFLQIAVDHKDQIARRMRK